MGVGWGYPHPALDGGTLIQPWTGVPPSSLGWGVLPSNLEWGYPHPALDGGVPQSSLGREVPPLGTPPSKAGWGTSLSKAGWGTPLSKASWGYPPPPSKAGQGYPSHPVMGVVPWQGWGTPRDRTADGVLDKRRSVCLLRSRRRI